MLHAESMARQTRIVSSARQNRHQHTSSPSPLRCHPSSRVRGWEARLSDLDAGRDDVQIFNYKNGRPPPTEQCRGKKEIRLMTARAMFRVVGRLGQDWREKLARRKGVPHLDVDLVQHKPSYPLSAARLLVSKSAKTVDGAKDKCIAVWDCFVASSHTTIPEPIRVKPCWALFSQTCVAVATSIERDSTCVQRLRRCDAIERQRGQSYAEDLQSRRE